MKWRVILEPDPETSEWAIWCPELPGCTSAGVTQEEALNNIREAIELYLQPDTIQLLPGAIICEVAWMTRLRRMKADEVELILHKHGFKLISQKGSHRKWRSSGGNGFPRLRLVWILGYFGGFEFP